MKNNRGGQKFDDFRQLYFDEIAYDKGLMFNFFLKHNDIFQRIEKDDEDILIKNLIKYRLRQSYVLIGSYVAILFTDKILLRNRPKYPNFRATIFLSKYIGLPLLFYGFGRYYLNSDVRQSFKEMAYKYDFGYKDYNLAMDILERAEKVGRLDELMEQREKFDWTGIPEYKSKYVIDD